MCELLKNNNIRKTDLSLNIEVYKDEGLVDVADGWIFDADELNRTNATDKEVYEMAMSRLVDIWHSKGLSEYDAKDISNTRIILHYDECPIKDRNTATDCNYLLAACGDVTTDLQLYFNKEKDEQLISLISDGCQTCEVQNNGQGLSLSSKIDYLEKQAELNNRREQTVSAEVDIAR